MSNFNFIQSTPNSLNNSNIQSFTSDNVKNNIIIAITLALGHPQGTTGIITDTQGNVYTAIQTDLDSSHSMVVWAAINIAGGPNTLTSSDTGFGCLWAAEYSSALNYFICPSGGSFTPPPNISSVNCGYGNSGAPSFSSASECVFVCGFWSAGAGPSTTWALTGTGNIRLHGGILYDFGTGICFVDDSVSNVSSPYNNGCTNNGGYSGISAGIIMNLNKTSCAFSVGPGTGSSGGTPGAVGNIFV